jgi:hypothetical protein
MGIGNGGYCGCGEGAPGPRMASTGTVGVRGGQLRVCGIPYEAWQRGVRCTGPWPLRTAPSPGTSLDATAIRRVVRRNLGQVRHCYEQALALVPNAVGRVAVRWVIGSEGAVLASEVTDNATGSTPLGECVAHAVRRWQFPATDSVVTVNYPFDLSVVE